MNLPAAPLRRLAWLSGIVLLGIASFSAPSWADSAPGGVVQPTAVADQTNLVDGQFVRVSGTGWGAPGPLVSVQVCGNAGLNQPTDCDLAGTASGAIRAGGVFYTGITVHRPPKDCPCVLRVSTAGRPDEVRLPVTIQGMPDAPLTSPIGLQRRVVISNVTVEGSGPWTSWFGAAPERDLVFSVTNTGDTVLHHPSVTLAWGRGSSPDGFIPPPDLGDLAPGQTTVTRVPIPLHALSFGTYRVTINADPAGGESATGFAETTIVPWALVILALLLLQGLLVAIRNWYRRHHVAAVETAAGEAATTDAAEEPDEVIDLRDGNLEPVGAGAAEDRDLDVPPRVDV